MVYSDSSGTSLLKVTATDDDGRDNTISYEVTDVVSSKENDIVTFSIGKTTGIITHDRSFPILSNVSDVSDIPYYIISTSSYLFYAV